LSRLTVLVHPEPDDAVTCIGQPAHAWLSGQLARAWGNARFGALEPREEVCLAAEQHDVGMAAWDAAPGLDPATGRPYGFMEMPLAVHVELWSRAPELALAQSPYAALLVSMHGTALYALRDVASMAQDDARRVHDYREAQAALQARLRASLGVSQAEASRNQRLIWTWDFLSLALCLGWAPTAIDDVPGAAGAERLQLTPTGDGHVVIDPWPFAVPELDVHCDARRLEGRFDSEHALHEALAGAPWRRLRWRLASYTAPLDG
jgi:hypothetical protein